MAIAFSGVHGQHVFATKRGLTFTLLQKYSGKKNGVGTYAVALAVFFGISIYLHWDEKNVLALVT